MINIEHNDTTNDALIEMKRKADMEAFMAEVIKKYAAPTTTVCEPLYGGAFYQANGDLLYIKQVIFNNPATIVFWSDGTKTTAICDRRDAYSSQVGVVVAVLKKLTSTKFVSKLIEDWVPQSEPKATPHKITLSDVRKTHRQKSNN